MKFRVFVIMLCASAGASAADKHACEVADLVPGKGWVYTKVPCSSLERKIPCTKEWTDEKGHSYGEEVPCPPGSKQKTVEQVQREEDAAKARRCGRDFGQLRVGMTLERFEACNEAAAYVTVTTGRSGSVEMYRSTFYWLHVKDGQIIGFTRRTH